MRYRGQPAWPLRSDPGASRLGFLGASGGVGVFGIRFGGFPGLDGSLECFGELHSDIRALVMRSGVFVESPG